MLSRVKLVYLAVGVAVGFGAGALTGRVTAPQPEPAAEDSRFALELEGRPLRGPKDAPVTIIEFTDYQCPFCKRYYEVTYPVLIEKYADRVSYAVRHYPIAYQHRRAHKAAQAAECAGDQGRFFQYHDVLFTRNRQLADDDLVRYAAMLGLDTDDFQRCLESGEKADVVDDDIQAGLERGIMGTPAFLVNGRLLVGAQPTEVFERLIERELARR